MLQDRMWRELAKGQGEAVYHQEVEVPASQSALGMGSLYGVGAGPAGGQPGAQAGGACAAGAASLTQQPSFQTDAQCSQDTTTAREELGDMYCDG